MILFELWQGSNPRVLDLLMALEKVDLTPELSGLSNL